jgi:hypothetical protein
MATNSFVAKGWALTVAGVIYGFAANHLNPWIASAGLLPSLGFWWLDAYYLLHERLFRCLYNDAHTPSTSVALFAMNIRPYKKLAKYDLAQCSILYNALSILRHARAASTAAAA